MTLPDSLLFDGVTLKEDRQRQVAEMLAELGFCTVEEQVQLKCYYCDAEIDPNAVTPPNHECPECERSIETDRCEQRETLMIRIDRPSTYSGIRRYCKSAAGLQYSSKSSVTYRRTDKGAKQDEKIEYRFVLQNDKKITQYTAQVLFDPPSKTIIRTMRLRGHSVPSILVGEAMRAADRLDEFDLPNMTAGKLAETKDAGVVEFLERGEQEYQRKYVDMNAETAIKWCTDRRDLEAIGDDEFEFLVQAMLDKLLIPSKLFGRDNVATEVPDGVIGFEKDGREYSFMWDAKYIKMDHAEAENLVRSPYVPLLPGENHSLNASEYRKIADHARMYQSDQDLMLDGVILIAPAIPDDQLENVQEKLEQVCDQWSGRVILLTLDAILGLLYGQNEDRGDIRRKRGRFNRLVVDYLTDRGLHNDPELAEAERVIKFDHDDVDALFDELADMSSEQETPDFRVFLRRRQR